jgi:hypothetical protein
MTKTLSNLIIGWALAVMAVQSAMAQSGASFVKEGVIGGVQHLSGGVGLEERAAIQAMAKDYNLKLVFALSSGQCLSNLMVGIEDAHGKLLLHTESNGPWFLANIPPGQYRITVCYGGKKKVRSVEVGKTLQTVMFLWKAR